MYLVSCPTQKDAPTFMSRRRTALARFPLISAKAAIDSSSTFSAFGRNLLYILSFCGLNPKKKTLPPKIMKNYHCYTDSTDKTMVYVNLNNIRDKMPLFYCIDHVMFL